MRSLRSFARSRFALALLVLATLAHQAGAVAHGGMVGSSRASGDGLHDICTSAGLVHLPGVPEPAQSPSGLDVLCDLCATATMASLPPPPASRLAGVSAANGDPVVALVVPAAPSPRRAHRSRAPPISPI
jgi:hypothetical protein